MQWLIFLVVMNAESEILDISTSLKPQFSSLERCNSALLTKFVDMKDKSDVTFSVNDRGSYVLSYDMGKNKWQNLCSAQRKEDLQPLLSIEDILKRRESE